MVQNWKDVIGRLMDVGSLETKEDASMKLIAGLGNPGNEYEGTRHNIGFMILDTLAEHFGTKIRQRKFNALIEEVYADNTKLLLVKPQQYMNRSGHAIATSAGFYKLAPSDVLIVTDDMALDVGRIRFRAKGSAGGHNGLKDIIARLGSDNFPRLRVGIGDSGRMDSADYVLSRFSADERMTIDKAVQTAVEAVLCWLRDGIDIAMTRYNVRSDSEES
jgi:PTH1 family peptidyl-tRNA hydrolase